MLSLPKLGAVLLFGSALVSPANQIVTWGDNSFGQTNVPPELTNILAIACGSQHTLALKADGTVAVWGNTNSGQCDVPAYLQNVVAIAGGDGHSLALLADGRVIAWGDNQFGQTDVPYLFDVVAIAAGANHNLALHSDGSVVAWGDNSSGQTNVPVELTNVVAIAAGDSHSLALTGEGRVIAWGDNGSGQTNVIAGLNNVIAIAGGGSHSLALKANGKIVSWGSQDFVPGSSASYGATIISTSPASTNTGVSKSAAQDGNAVVNRAADGLTVVHAESGLSIWANGRANVDQQATVSSNSVSMLNWGKASQVPDFTSQGTAASLFDFNRLIAVADSTPLSTNLNPTGDNHFTNLTRFLNACNQVMATPARALEGVVVVNIRKSDSYIQFNQVPNAINVRGTLVFNFNSDWGPFDKLITTATFNINPANLAGLVGNDPSTYTSGYPPTYYDSSKQPWKIDITSKGYSNFTPADDFPALVYKISVLDIHGNANICGAVCSPSFAEIENKQDNQIQYFNGSYIGGGGVYIENGHESISIFTSSAKSIGINARSSNNLSLKASGRITAWGSMTNVPAGLSNVTAIAAGAAHEVALIGSDSSNGLSNLGAPLVLNAVSGSNGFSVSFPSRSGHVYALEFKNSLSESNWIVLPLVAGTGGWQALIDHNPSVAQRFYRVQQW